MKALLFIVLVLASLDANAIAVAAHATVAATHVTVAAVHTPAPTAHVTPARAAPAQSKEAPPVSPKVVVPTPTRQDHTACSNRWIKRGTCFF